MSLLLVPAPVGPILGNERLGCNPFLVDFRVVLHELLDRVLDKVVLLVLQNAANEVIEQIRLVLMSNVFKMLPLFTSQDFEFVKTEVVDAEVLEILRVVRMGH